MIHGSARTMLRRLKPGDPGDIDDAPHAQERIDGDRPGRDGAVDRLIPEHQPGMAEHKGPAGRAGADQRVGAAVFHVAEREELGRGGGGLDVAPVPVNRRG